MTGGYKSYAQCCHSFGKTVEIQSRSASVWAIFIRMRSRRLSCLRDIYAVRYHQKSVYVRISPYFRGFISRFHIVACDFLSGFEVSFKDVPDVVLEGIEIVWMDESVFFFLVDLKYVKKY